MSSTSKNKTALITGASGGIGLELARVFGREGYNLILVARSEQALHTLAAELKGKYSIQVQVMAHDLAAAGAPEVIFKALAADGIHIDVLVNNAGFATYGRFVEIDWSAELQEMQLNMIALTHFTKLFLKPMIGRGEGKILNVASTASFQPGPLMAVYYATKAYVLSFSEAIAAEVGDQGVTVTTLCPGPTESGFQKRADIGETKLVQRGLMRATDVAEAGYRALMQGKTIEIPGMTNKIGALLPRFVPRNAVTRIVMNMQERV